MEQTIESFKFLFKSATDCLSSGHFFADEIESNLKLFLLINLFLCTYDVCWIGQKLISMSRRQFIDNNHKFDAYFEYKQHRTE